MYFILRILLLVAIGFSAFSMSQDANISCAGLVGDTLLQCISNKVEYLQSELTRAQTRINDLEQGMRFYPHPQGQYERTWRVNTSTFYANESLALEGTNAQYALATGYAVFLDSLDDDDKDLELGVHVFGRNLNVSQDLVGALQGTNYFHNGGGNMLSSRKGEYSAFVTYGDVGGKGDKYGNYGLLMIPLKDNQKMDVLLAAGTNPNRGTYVVILQVLGYFE